MFLITLKIVQLGHTVWDEHLWVLNAIVCGRGDYFVWIDVLVYIYDFLSLSVGVSEHGALKRRRRWTTGSAQQSNMCGTLPCMFWIFLSICQKQDSLSLGPIQPSSPSIQELHGQIVSHSLMLSLPPSLSIH